MGIFWNISLISSWKHRKITLFDILLSALGVCKVARPDFYSALPFCNYRSLISRSMTITPVNNIVRGALSQKSRILNSLGVSRPLHTMSVNMAGHRIEKDTFGNYILLVNHVYAIIFIWNYFGNHLGIVWQYFLSET